MASAGPRTSRRRVTGSSECTRTSRSLRFRMMSVTSSLTPGSVVNSWSASSKRSWVTAPPGMDESSVRRSELPSVCAEARVERADGEALAVVLLLVDDFDGRPLDDQHGGYSCCGWGRAIGYCYFEYSSTMSCSWTGSSMCSRSGGLRTDTEKPASPVSSQAGSLALEGVHVPADEEVPAGRFAQDDLVALAHPVARDGDPLAVHAARARGARTGGPGGGWPPSRPGRPRCRGGARGCAAGSRR